jgi:hypothetical protein
LAGGLVCTAMGGAAFLAGPIVRIESSVVAVVP